MTACCPQYMLVTTSTVQALIADTEGEILALVGDRDAVDPRPVRDGPLPPRPRRQRRARAASGCGRCSGLLAYAVHHRRRTSGPCPAPRRSSSATTSASSTTTSRTATRAAPPADAVDAPRRPPGDQHRRHHLRSLTPIALHRLTDLGFSDEQGPAPHAPVRRDLPGPVRGPVHRHLDVGGRGPHVGRAVLRHDRAQDGRPHRRPRSRPAPCWRPTTRRSIAALPRLRLGARPRLPAQRRPARASGARSRRPARQPSDLAQHKKTLPVLYAFEHAGPADRRAARRRSTPNRSPTPADDRRGHRDPRADRRPRLHPRPGPSLPRRGPRRARRAPASVEPEAARDRLEAIIVSVISA